jgi:hypothetical protein
MRFCGHSSTFGQHKVDLKKQNMKAVQFASDVCTIFVAVTQVQFSNVERSMQTAKRA